MKKVFTVLLLSTWISIGFCQFAGTQPLEIEDDSVFQNSVKVLGLLDSIDSSMWDDSVFQNSVDDSVFQNSVKVLGLLDSFVVNIHNPYLWWNEVNWTWIDSSMWYAERTEELKLLETYIEWCKKQDKFTVPNFLGYYTWLRRNINQNLLFK